MSDKEEKDNKSSDKKEIEVEEREKMLNAENKSLDDKLKNVVDQKESEEVINIAPIVNVTEEGREVKPKKIPIGGIKMPGFFTRSKSKEKCKDGETDGAESELLEAAPCVDATCTEKAPKDAEAKKTNRLSLKLTNPFTKRPKSHVGEEEAKTPEETENAPPKKGLLNAIKLPLVNMIPRKLKPVGGDGDTELGLGPQGRAGLASMETLDDSKEEKVETPSGEDGMETVKLDIEDKTEDTEKKDLDKKTLCESIRKYRCIIDDMVIAGGVLLFLLKLCIIIIVVIYGLKKDIIEAPIKDGKYVEAVTSCGPVEGVLEDSAFAFRGIPYAVAPIGENRWLPAQHLNQIDLCWNGTFLAHNGTPPCIQIYDNGSKEGEEDCLTIDVVTPHVRYDTPLPVVVLIGSESLTGGSPGKMRPSARFARAKDVVFVRPNFRVGVLGFLSLETLSKSTHPPTSGNYALSDIIVALEWVQLNIKHFGGDPEAVTVLGHRAGATLVSLLTTLSNAKNLFARTWVTSGAAIYPGKVLIESERANERFLEQTQCKDAACLREKDAKDLIDAVPDTWRRVVPDLPTVLEEADKRHEWLVLDGRILKTHPADFWSKEENQPLKMVIGTTAHESYTETLYQKYTEWTPQVVAQYVRDSKIGELGLADDALKLYNSTFQGLVAMISDIRTVCPLLIVSQKQSLPFYVVTQPRGDLDLADVDVDVLAILGRYEPKTPEQRRYLSAMQQLFYHYVWHGEVTQVEDSRDRIFEVGQDVLPKLSNPNCDFWISADVVPRYGRLD